MKRSTFALLGALLLTATPLFAIQGGPKSKPPKPPASATKTTKVKPVTVKATVGKPKLVTKSTKPVKTTTAAKTIKVTTKPVKVDKVKPVKADKTMKSASANSKKSTIGTTSTTTTTGTVTLTPVQQKLQRNTNLASKLRGRLPDGTDLMRAAYGFKNLGQFVAAVNVSNNHGIPFAQLKRKMVTEGLSLGQAIQALKPASSTTIDARRAEADARIMIADSERELAPTTTTAKAKTRTKAKRAVGGE